MKKLHRPFIAVLLAFVLIVVTGMLGWDKVLAQPAPIEKTVVASVVGAIGGSGGSAEAVIFTGQASISGKVIHDTVFGAPPVLEISVDLSHISGKGLRSGKTYLVSSQAILHRPLIAFDPIEVSFPFFADGDMLAARSAVANFSVLFSAARGITTTRVVVTPNLPG